MSEVPKEFNDPLFSRLFLLAKINIFTAEEHRQYIKSLELMSEWDNIIKSTAERERAEGRAEERAEIVKEMLADGMPVEIIAKYTKLSFEEIAALKW